MPIGEDGSATTVVPATMGNCCSPPEDNIIATSATRTSGSFLSVISSDEDNIAAAAAGCISEAEDVRRGSAATVCPGDVQHPANWAISYDQLLQLDEDARQHLGHHYETATMHDVSKALLQPRCAQTGTSVALELNPQGLKLTVFVSHAWKACHTPQYFSPAT